MAVVLLPGIAAQRAEAIRWLVYLEQRMAFAILKEVEHKQP